MHYVHGGEVFCIKKLTITTDEYHGVVALHQNMLSASMLARISRPLVMWLLRLMVAVG